MKYHASEDLLTRETEVVGEDLVIVRLAGEIDISSAHLLSAQFGFLVEEGRAAVIVDASDVSFMDCTGLHALVEGKRKLHDNGSRIILVPSRQVRRVIDLVFADSVVVEGFDSLEEALAALDVAGATEG